MKRGMTLIEVLSVIVIVSLVASLTAVGLAATHDRARLRDAAARMRELDAHARLLAGSVGAVLLSIDEEGRHVTLRTAEGDEVLATAAPPHVTVTLDDQPIVFDRLGRSRDYTVTLTSGDDVVRLAFLGLTGRVVEPES